MRLCVVVSLGVCAGALVAPRAAPRSPRPALDTRGDSLVVVRSSAAEVSIAASQQLLALGAVAVGEGVWASTVGGFGLGKALRYVGPAAAAAAVLVAASGSVASGDAQTMGPGLAASTAACVGLLASYGLRLAAAQDGEAPPKEVVGLAAALAFFGFSTAVQSFFAAGVLDAPTLAVPDLGLPMLPNINSDAALGLPPDAGFADVAAAPAAAPLVDEAPGAL